MTCDKVHLASFVCFGALFSEYLIMDLTCLLNFDLIVWVLTVYSVNELGFLLSQKAAYSFSDSKLPASKYHV